MSLLDDASLLVTPNARKEGKLYSIIPTNGNGDFSVTRATTATRVNAAGLVELVPYNLLPYSEMFSNAAWTKTNSSISANTTTAPNGTLTADTLIENNVNGAHLVSQAITSSGASFSVSLYAKAKERSKILIFFVGASNKGYGFDLANGTMSAVSGVTSADSFSITNVGNGWYRCTIVVNATSSTAVEIYPLQSFSNYQYAGDGTSGLFIWGAQLVAGTSALDYQATETRLNIPRLDYSLGSCPNILLEPQRTNVLLNTIFSGSGATPTSWTQPVATGTSVLTTSTLGTGAQACSQSATLQRPFLSQSFTLVANTTYSYSIYVESISGGLPNENILLASGLPVGATATYFSNGVSVSPTATAVVGRLSINIVVSVLGGAVGFRCGIGSSGAVSGTLLFSRPQLEAGAYATSYIPTTSASVTRNADVISRGNIFTNGLITAAGGTWFLDFRNNLPILRSSILGALFLDTSSSTPTNGFLFIGGLNSQRLIIYKTLSGVVSQLFITTTNSIKVAIKWNGTTADVFVNGVKVVTATAFTPTAMENILANGIDTPKYINSMALFPTPLTDTQCIALTT
jgi:hypothetical protein